MRKETSILTKWDIEFSQNNTYQNVDIVVKTDANIALMVGILKHKPLKKNKHHLEKTSS